MKPRFGLHGQDRSNSPHQNMTRPQCPRPSPPFHKGSGHSRGNGNQNRPRRPQGPQVSMEGRGGQIMRPNRPMMCPNGPMPPMVMPCGPMMGPNGPMMGPNGPMVPPGFMDPASFNMMMRSMMPGTPMPKFANGDFSEPPPLSSEKESIQWSGKNNPGTKNGTGQNSSSTNGENCDYNYSHFPNFQNSNCGWQGNPFPNAWNFKNGMNQFYPQNSDPQFTNNQSFYQNPNQNCNENYYQYQNQQYMHSNYYNDNQNHSYFKSNQNNWQNGTPCSGSKTTPKNNSKKKEMCQKMRTHYCDTCDKSFGSEEALATHLSEHKVCGLDGCKFTAHPKVVDKHQQMQHFTGLYRRIGSLYTPEDIEKWRKERKKNYPTPQNVEERRAKQEEMYARGERMGARNNRFSRHNQQRNGRHVQPRQPHRPDCEERGDSPGRRPPPPSGPPTGPAEPPKKWKPVFPPVTFEIEESEERSGVAPFPGTAALLPKFTSTETGEATQTNNSSLSFLSMYGDGVSEEDSDTERSPDDSTSCPVERNIRKTLSVETEGSSKPESECFNELHQAEPTSLVEDIKEMEVGQVSPQEGEVNCSGGSEGLQNRIAEEESELVGTPDCSEVPLSLPSKEPEHPVSDSAEKCQPSGSRDPTGTEKEKDLVCEAETAISNATDDSNDSGPEEVPISKNTDSIGDKENSHDEDADEIVQNGEGGRKRRRQSRQPPKKMKTGDEKPTTESQRQQQNKRHENINRPQRPHRPPIRRAPTLLEKLLSQEICHERNVILQCVRYVVENNYFRSDRSQTTEASTS